MTVSLTVPENSGAGAAVVISPPLARLRKKRPEMVLLSEQGRGEKNRQSMAEAIAKHLNSEVFQNSCQEVARSHESVDFGMETQ